MAKLIQKYLKPFEDELIWAAWFVCLRINSLQIQKISYFSNHDDNVLMSRIDDENNKKDQEMCTILID